MTVCANYPTPRVHLTAFPSKLGGWRGREGGGRPILPVLQECGRGRVGPLEGGTGEGRVESGSRRRSDTEKHGQERIERRTASSRGRERGDHIRRMYFIQICVNKRF